MKAGRKPTPTALKLVQGNRGKRAVNKAEAVVALAEPTPPAFLCDDAKVEWGRVCSALYAAGLMTELDRAALAAYCAAYGRLLAQTVAAFTRDGYVHGAAQDEALATWEPSIDRPPAFRPDLLMIEGPKVPKPRRVLPSGLRRWQEFTGEQATLESDGRTFAEVQG